MSQWSRDLVPGMVLDGRYELMHHIGSGGMGSVYAARRLAIGDLVAIKQLNASTNTPENRSQLLIEAKAAAHIRHPCVVEVFDFGGTDDGTPYMVMEHLEGKDLGRLLADQGRLSIPRALELFAPICAAVEAGHRRGVIHRDIKPSNVLITRSDDDREMVKVLDFGLAIFGSEQDPTEPEPKMVGTPQFMAPEVLRGELVTPATDIFALGSLLFQMVTGEHPYLGKSPLQILIAVAQGEARPASEIVPDLPPELVEVLARALDSDPSARPSSPEQLARRAELASRSVLPLPSPRVIADEEPPDPGNLKHFAGRDQELSRLRGEYRRALEGEGRVVTLVGDPGIGKTRLVEHFAHDLLAREQVVVLWGRFYDQQGSQTPAYQTFRTLLTQGSDLSSSGLGTAVRPSEPVGHVFELDGEGDAWRVHATVADALAARAGGRPLVLVLDDLQWAGRADLDLLEHLHQALGHRGTLMIVTLQAGHNNQEARRWQKILAARRSSLDLRLKPFQIEEVETLLRSSFDSLHIHPADLRRLHKTSGGNPFFLAEIVRHLLASKKIDRSPEGWRCGSLDGMELPPTLLRLLETRLSDLAAELRRMLEVAAVIGDPLRFEIVAAVAQMDEELLETLFDSAVSEGLLRDDIVPEGSDYAFAADSIRRAVYDSTSRGRRRRLHRRALEALRSSHSHSVAPGAGASMLAQHAAAIEDWPETFRWGLEATDHALKSHDGDTAETCLRAAQTAMDRLQAALPREARMRFEWIAGVVARRSGRLQDAKIHLLRASEGFTAPDRRVGVRLELARCMLAVGELDDGLALARELASRDRSLESADLAVQIGMCEAGFLLRLGRFAEAAQGLDSLLELGDDVIGISSRARILRERSWAALKMGDFSAAESKATRGLDLARVAGDLPAEHHCIAALAAIHAETDDIEKALPFHHKALELARRLSLRRREGIDLANLGEAHFRLEDHDRALEHFRTALGIFIEIGDRACEGDCRVNIGRALLAQGNTETALETLDAGRTICESTGRIEYAGIARLYEGQAFLTLEDLDAASRSYESARDLFADQGSYLLWRAELGLAEVAMAEGDSERALSTAHEVRARLSSLGGEPARAGSRYLEQALTKVEELLSRLD